MKILELRFKNLNSLYGEWLIDFTDPEYISNGIFALTGPTGAGKSTILDAICLALYGSTPRLGRITKSGNEIMSRQTSECSAEVVFESQAGRFRCHWNQSRARKKADGKLQDANHEISDAHTGKAIETKKSLVSGVIEEKTGMDFDRFTRSILLAQGGFDTFLKADAEQKSRILEQITGTEIYSEISKKVHERQKEEHEKQNLLHAEISGITILEPEQESEIQQKIKDKQEKEIKLTQKTTETEKAITWLTTVNNLKNEIRDLFNEANILQNDLKAFKPKRETLNQALKAFALDTSYVRLSDYRKQQTNDQEALKTEKKILPDKENTAAEHAAALQLAEKQTIKGKKERTESAPLIKKIRSLDQKLGEQKKNILLTQESCCKINSRIESDSLSKKIELDKRSEAELNLESSKRYIKEYSQDELLLSGLTGIEEQLGSLLSVKKEINQKEITLNKVKAALNQAADNLNNYTKLSGKRKQEVKEASSSLQHKKQVLIDLLDNKRLREYRAEKESLLRESALLAKITELEEHRAKLEDGKACPLCGAKEHPYAQGNIPAADEIEKKIETLTKLIQRAEDQEAVIKKMEAEEEKARNNTVESEKLEAAAANEKTNISKALSDIEDSIKKMQTLFAESEQLVLEKLKSLGITEMPDSGYSVLLESLRQRLKTWQEKLSEISKIEKQISEIDGGLKGLDVVLETQSINLKEKQEILESFNKEYKAENENRKQLYENKNPDAEEFRLNKVITDAEESERKSRTLHSELQQELTSIKAKIELKEKQIIQREAELQKLETEFSKELTAAGFADEHQFEKVRISEDERKRLSDKVKELDTRQTDLKARQTDREKRLTAESAKKITDKSLTELQVLFTELKETQKQIQDLIAELKHKLNENTAAKNRIAGKQDEINAQKKECLRWEKLHGLIGSADGKKYRNFAQGLTFELMVSHANRQLEKMSDRYLLMRDTEQPMELNVVDNYQAGEIRSTKNLSGGESFIVSLTLALGLSKMASRKVRVDSLFLDEGFGTLDEEALETALETLSGLQQEGKLIGIISHVPALKERISTQIAINPVSGGRSEVAGPGCRKVE